MRRENILKKNYQENVPSYILCTRSKFYQNVFGIYLVIKKNCLEIQKYPYKLREGLSNNDLRASIIMDTSLSLISGGVYAKFKVSLKSSSEI